ncbi:MAG: type II toxin-antitoxin system HicB family antitoxin [Porticoccaceae bacterium]
MSELTYKGYIADIEFSPEDGCFFGRLANIRDLVNFEADTAKGLVTAFQEAVDDYLASCEAEGKTPNKPFKGVFNVRTGSDLHRSATLAAKRHGMNLNAFVVTAIEEKVASASKTQSTQTEAASAAPR